MYSLGIPVQLMVFCIAVDVMVGAVGQATVQVPEYGVPMPKPLGALGSGSGAGSVEAVVGAGGGSVVSGAE